MESNVSHNRRAIRSISATARRSSSRSDSSSPFRRVGSGLLSVLRQKFSIRIARGDGESSRYRGDDPDAATAAGTSATLCSSWRSRPRHVDKPIRPAYSDECLSCCGRSTCLRSRTQHHRHQTSQEMTRFDQPSHRAAAVAAAPSTSRKVVGIVICKHCHAKNDRSPSDFEISQDVSQSEDEKVLNMLPADKEYGHAMAPTTANVTVTCDLVTVHSSPHDCVTLTSSHHIEPSTSSSASGGSSSGAAVAVFDDLTLTAVPPSQPFYDQVKETSSSTKPWSLSRELFKLSKHGWYWGPISRVEAEEKLAGQPDGSFLVRDSSDDRYLLSLSFRSYGRTLHTRIEHCNGVFSFYAQPESEAYSSIVDLVEHSMTDSQSGVFCYSRARIPGSPSFPVRLARPVSRFAQVRTLQYLCRFCIRQYTRVDHIQQLPLPTSIKGWLEEGQY